MGFYVRPCCSLGQAEERHGLYIQFDFRTWSSPQHILENGHIHDIHDTTDSNKITLSDSSWDRPFW